MSFTRNNVKAFRLDLAAALKSVEEKYNCKCNIDTARVTFSDNDVRFKFEAKINNGVSEEENDQYLWETHCHKFGLTSEMFGQDIMLKGTSYTISGIKPTARKNCVKITGAKGGTWLTSASAVKSQLTHL